MAVSPHHGDDRLVGGGLAVQVFVLLTKRAGDPKRTATFARDVSWTAMRVFRPSAAVVFLSGVALMVDGNWNWDEPFAVVGLSRIRRNLGGRLRLPRS
jgi:uncharacterized membrane protein